MFCSLCYREIHNEGLCEHVEQYHVGLKSNDSLYNIGCGSCNFLTDDRSLRRMMDHLLLTKHRVEAINFDWAVFMEREEKRVYNVIKSGLRLIMENQSWEAQQNSEFSQQLQQPDTSMTFSKKPQDNKKLFRKPDESHGSLDSGHAENSDTWERVEDRYQYAVLTLPDNVIKDSIQPERKRRDDLDKLTSESNDCIFEPESEKTVNRQRILQENVPDIYPSSSYPSLNIGAFETMTQICNEKMGKSSNREHDVSISPDCDPKQQRKQFQASQKSFEGAFLSAPTSRTFESVSPKNSNLEDSLLQNRFISTDEGIQENSSQFSDSAAKIGPISCKICGQTFSATQRTGDLSKSLIVHCCSKHFGEKLIECSSCEIAFLTNVHFLKHEREQSCNGRPVSLKSEVKENRLRDQLKQCFPTWNFESHLTQNQLLGNFQADKAFKYLSPRLKTPKKGDCHLCPKNSLPHLHAMLKHVITHSKLKLLKCKGCEFRGRRPRCFVSHSKWASIKGCDGSYTSVGTQEDGKTLRALLQKGFPEFDWNERFPPGKKMCGLTL